MMVSLGVGGVAAGIMHLLAHGFFKALLFLGSGSVIHGCHEEQDIRKMGGLRGLMPVTFLTYAIGMMALERGAALFLRSLDEGGNPARHLAVERLATSALSHAGRRGADRALHDAADDLRLLRRRAAPRAEHAHESPPVMTLPLIVLAICAIVFSVVLTPAWPWLHEYLSGRTARLSTSPCSFSRMLYRLARPGRGRNWTWGLGLSQGPRDRSGRAHAAAALSLPRKSDVAR